VVGCLLEKHEGFTARESETVRACLREMAKSGGAGLPPAGRARMAALLVKKHMSTSDALRLYGTYVANWGGKAIRYRFDAVRGDAVVKTVIREPAERVALEAVARNPVLTDGPTWDCAAIALRAVDQNGNTLPYCGDAVTVTVEGPAHVLGPSVVPLRGGMAGTYVATEGRAGTAQVTCTLPGAAPVRLALEITCGDAGTV
jgi:beta-galactosidase